MPRATSRSRISARAAGASPGQQRDGAAGIGGGAGRGKPRQRRIERRIAYRRGIHHEQPVAVGIDPGGQCQFHQQRPGQGPVGRHAGAPDGPAGLVVEREEDDLLGQRQGAHPRVRLAPARRTRATSRR
jgi:hypothetical protein